MLWIYVGEQRGHYRAGLQVTTQLRRVRELRRQQTPAEEMLWEELRGRKFLGLKFRRQHQYGSYILDFLCPELWLVIEVDGGIHDTPEQQEHDREREKFLRDHELHIVRFTNDMVLKNLDQTLRQLEAICRQLDDRRSDVPPKQ